MSGEAVENFLRLLKESPAEAVFNPWWQSDRENDIDPTAPRVRRTQLCAYFEARLKTVRLAIVGEALGYQGGHFTGIPMTSERILLGRNERVDVDPSAIVPGLTIRRTSKPAICRDGFSEPTATMVWASLLGLGIEPNEFVLWNAFPWHSFDPTAGMLSNRTPNKKEKSAGLPILKLLVDLFNPDQFVGLGRIAAEALEALDIKTLCVRHPASGGAKLFRCQIATAVRRI